MERCVNGNEQLGQDLLQRYVDELTSQINDENGDPYFKACYVAQIQELHSNPHFESIVQTYLSQNEEKATSYHTNHIARALQYPLMPDASLIDYPRAWNVSEPWMQHIDRLSVPDSQDRAVFEKTLSWPLSSNVARRAFPIAILLGKMSREGRVGDEVKILEVGYSQGQLLTKLALLHTGPIDPIVHERLVTVSNKKEGFRQDYVFDSRGTRVIKKWIESCPRITGAGTDIQDANDPEVTSWARSNTLRPNDLVNHGGLAAEAYDLIEMSNPDSMQFHQADFSRLNAKDWRALRTEGGYDAVIFATVNNQLDPKKVKKFNENADKLVNARGFVAELDFSLPNPTDPSTMLRYKRWFTRKHQYSLTARRADDLGNEYHHIMSADTSRCDRVSINKRPLELFLRKRITDLRD